jgi:hypothetical protein
MLIVMVPNPPSRATDGSILPCPVTQARRIPAILALCGDVAKAEAVDWPLHQEQNETTRISRHCVTAVGQLRLLPLRLLQHDFILPVASKGWTDAPAFAAIANCPGTTTAKMTAILGRSHMNMLNTVRH